MVVIVGSGSSAVYRANRKSGRDKERVEEHYGERCLVWILDLLIYTSVGTVMIIAGKETKKEQQSRESSFQHGGDRHGVFMHVSYRNPVTDKFKLVSCGGHAAASLFEVVGPVMSQGSIRNACLSELTGCRPCELHSSIP